MRIRVLFFGMLRDIVGLREDTLELSDGDQLGSVFDHYSARFPRLMELSKSIVLAHNQRFAAPSTLLSDDDEVAFLPPVSGGAAERTGVSPLCATENGCFTHEISDPDGHFFAITRDPIDSRALTARLQRGEDGAVVTFEGVTRNNTKGRSTRYLEYECYEAMAIKMMADIGRYAAANHSIGRIGIIHRVGRLEIGEASVVIVASAPHRRPAFEAALESIDRLKKLVPIWKKEFFADGEVWVDGEWDDTVIKARV